MKTAINFPESIICWHCKTQIISTVDTVYKGNYVMDDSDYLSVRQITEKKDELDVYVICPNEDCKAICILEGNNLTKEMTDAAVYRPRIHFMPD